MVRTHTGRGARGRGSRRVTSTSSTSVITVVALLAAIALAGPSRDALAATTVDLGTAGSFAVLAGSAITNTGPTTINGDVGLHPSGESSVTGFDDVTLTGETHYADGTANQAKSDLTTAYNALAGQSPSATVATELGTETLTGGVYDSASGTFEITGALTLDAQGDPGTVWIFQMATTLVTATDSSVLLINGADPCNVFWQVGTSATLGTGTTFAGSILAAESVTLNNSAAIIGRALASTGAVTMDTNVINQAGCPATVTPPPPDPSPSPSPSPDATSSPSPTGTTTDTTDAPEDADASGPVSPPTSGTPQVPTVPTGGVPAGDGSTLDGSGARLPIAALIATLALLAVAWRRYA